MAVMTKPRKFAGTVCVSMPPFIFYVSKHIFVDCFKVSGLMKQSRLCEAFKNDAFAIRLCISFSQSYPYTNDKKGKPNRFFDALQFSFNRFCIEDSRLLL